MLRRPIPPAVRRAFGLNAALTLLFAAWLRLNRARHYGPHEAGLPVAHRNFADLTDFAAQFQRFHSPEFFQQPSAYMHATPIAGMAVFYRFLFHFGPHAVAACVAALLLTVLAAAVLFTRALLRRGAAPLAAAALTALTLLFAWPVWFCLKQGNCEFLTFALLALGVWAFQRRCGYLAAACFALAGVLKIYPLFFLSLLLARRQYRAFFFGLAATAAALLASLWLICPDVAASWRGLLAELAAFRSGFVLPYQSAQGGLDHSLFALVKLLLAALGRHTLLADPARMSHLVTLYTVAVALLGIVLWIVRLRHLPVPNQVLALTVAALLLPPVSFEYTLMHLYIPWAVLVLFAFTHGREARIPGLLPALLLIALLVSPLTGLRHHTWGLAGELKALALALLFAIALIHPFPPRQTALPVR